MIYKEFKDIYKQVLIILSLLMIIPIIHFTKFSLIIKSSRTSSVSQIGYNSGNILYFSMFAYIILLISGILGLTMFRNEFKDNGFEYLFSAPLTKGEILLYKIIPRFILLFSITIIYIILFYIFFKDTQGFKEGLFILVLPKFLPLWILFYFFINLFLSIFKQKNWIALLNLLTLYTIFIFPFAIRVILRDLNFTFSNEADLLGYSFIISFIILLLLLGSRFLITYKKLDLREKYYTGNSFSKIIIPVEVTLLVSSIFILLK